VTVLVAVIRTTVNSAVRTGAHARYEPHTETLCGATTPVCHSCGDVLNPDKPAAVMNGRARSKRASYGWRQSHGHHAANHAAPTETGSDQSTPNGTDDVTGANEGPGGTGGTDVIGATAEGAAPRGVNVTAGDGETTAALAAAGELAGPVCFDGEREGELQPPSTMLKLQTTHIGRLREIVFGCLRVLADVRTVPFGGGVPISITDLEAVGLTLADIATEGDGGPGCDMTPSANPSAT